MDTKNKNNSTQSKRIDTNGQNAGVKNQSNGIKSQSNGAKNQSNGMKSRSTGVKSQSNGVKNQSIGMKTQSTGAKNQSTGVKSQSNGVKSRNTGIKSQSNGRINDTPYSEASAESAEKKRRIAEQRERNKKRKRRRARTIRILALLIVVVVAAAGLFHYFTKTSAEPYDSSSTQTTAINVKSGSTTSSIAELLADNGIVRSALGFEIQSKINHYDGKYKAGVYELSPSMSAAEIMEKLCTGGDDQITITIPEGSTTAQIAQIVAKTGLCTEEEFMQEVAEGDFDYKFMEYTGEGESRLEGFLYPETYKVAPEATAHNVINTLLAQFDKIFTEDYYTRAAELGYTPREIITIASMIQREAMSSSEFPIVASVIYNRLESGMKLQIDATVQYALGDQKDRLTTEDTKIDSPYNTYLVDGLPAGPISCPYDECISAALYPETTDYLYYVLKPDNSGLHNFAADYDTFLAYKDEYLQSLE